MIVFIKQVGTVVENAADFYCGRIAKSKRKKTIVDELLADAELKSYQKKKYKEIVDSNSWKKRPVKKNISHNEKREKKNKKTSFQIIKVQQWWRGINNRNLVWFFAPWTK